MRHYSAAPKAPHFALIRFTLFRLPHKQHFVIFQKRQLNSCFFRDVHGERLHIKPQRHRSFVVDFDIHCDVWPNLRQDPLASLFRTPLHRTYKRLFVLLMGPLIPNIDLKMYILNPIHATNEYDKL